ncbi:MAG: hypothetical protein JNK82_17155 [Myxococcaceae bacterium]|nr:hypothetical protein [Myxococcaceae bacterium]
MLVIVPTFMYIFFLDDALRAKLDMIEAVAMAPWEYARVNFEEGKAGSGTRSAIRLGWCDHVSDYNSYDKGYDCSESVHHAAHAAHQCWMTEGGKQVTCDVNPGAYKLDGLLTASSAHDAYTNGGMVRCSARLGVINYFLPQKLFTEFTTEDVTDAEKRSGDVHGNYGLATASHILLEEQSAGLVVDTWSLGKAERIDSGGNGTLKDRTNDIYQTYVATAAIGSMDFLTNILNNDVINMGLLTDTMGDDPSDANVAFDPDNSDDFNEGFYASPTGEALADKYMGNSNAPND